MRWSDGGVRERERWERESRAKEGRREKTVRYGERGALFGRQGYGHGIGSAGARMCARGNRMGRQRLSITHCENMRAQTPRYVTWYAPCEWETVAWLGWAAAYIWPASPAREAHLAGCDRCPCCCSPYPPFLLVRGSARGACFRVNRGFKNGLGKWISSVSDTRHETRPTQPNTAQHSPHSPPCIAAWTARTTTT